MKRNSESGFTLLEVMTAVAVMGILVAMAMPSLMQMLERQETKSSATQMAGLLADARARAVAEGTPHLVYINAPSVDGNGNCSAAAVEVRDVDHSYSITAGDQTKEFHLPDSACNKVKPFDASATSSDPAAAAAATVPMPSEDLAVKAPDAASVGAVAVLATSAVSNTVTSTANTVGAIAGSGSGSSGSSGSGSGSSGSGSGSGSTQGEDSSGSDGSGSGSNGGVQPPRSATVAETVVNGATFPVDAVSGRPVIAFSELGIPVDPASPNSWGSGAGGVYLTDSSGSTIVAALVEPLGDVKLRTYDPASQTWK
jgi:prepilin-type N-terminal cleavage/methylation domain-containing protein